MLQGTNSVSPEEAQAELEAVLASPGFTRSPRLARLLTFLCGKYLAGEADQIKEYSIGVEVLKRPPSFDPADDASARVEVHRLRRRLQEYYENEGKSRKLRIVIPVGHYVPAFVANIPSEPILSPAPVGGEAVSAVPPVNGTTASESAQKPVAGRGKRLPFTRSAILWVGLLVIAGAVLAVQFVWKPGSPGQMTKLRAAVEPPRPPARAWSGGSAPGAGAGVRLACGRTVAYTDRAGSTWAADRYFEGGTSFDTPRQFIARAFDPKLFQNARLGDFDYRIPLAAGVYELRMHFVEPTYGPGTPSGGGEYSRTFDVTANGRPILTGFDIYSDAAGTFVADTRVFRDISPGSDGVLHLQFRGKRAPALINAIELIPAQPHRLNPIRITSQENFLTDTSGNVWYPDNYVTGGQLNSHSVQVTGTADSDLFARERFGHFEYALPVDQGTYRLSLYFAEEYWGTGNAGGGGPGNRVFDVFCNGMALLRNFDILKEGGPNRAVIKTFHGLTPNAQGKLVVSFVPVRDYATLYALEVVDESN